MRESVDVLIARYKINLFVIAFNVCKNVHDAEDVVQDTFIQYISFEKDFETEEHIRAWLIRVAINKAKNKNRTFFMISISGIRYNQVFLPLNAKEFEDTHQ
jgi:DNA-directed RNA polymerase specialized sigma24 family protein